MIVEPDILSHPKFIQLKAIVGDGALELLVRIWTHCQQNKRGQFWRGAGRDYVEVVAAGRTQRGKIFEPLRHCGWIHEHADGIEIHDWDKHNASLVARWNRPQPPAQPPAQVSIHPSAQTPDRTGQDRTGPDITQHEPPLPPKGGPLVPSAPPEFDPPIPPALDTPAFQDAWRFWLGHLKQKKKSPTANAQTLQLSKLEKFGLAKAIETLRTCVEKNWRGVYEAKTGELGASRTFAHEQGGGIKGKSLT